MRVSLLKSAAAILSALLLVSCTSAQPHSGGGTPNSSPATLVSSGNPAPMPGVTAEAEKLGVSPGQVALGEIICRLDSSNTLEDLVSKNNSQGLLEILRETALQKSTTLESLNEKYGLTAILASEGIHVVITSNGITAQSASSSASSAEDWIPRFQSALSAGN